MKGAGLEGRIEFLEWTPDERLRHPRFVGIRSDNDPGDEVRESSPALSLWRLSISPIRSFGRMEHEANKGSNPAASAQVTKGVRQPAGYC
jgi:hypothetical protein